MKIDKSIKIPSKVKQLLVLYIEGDYVCYNKLVLDKQVELLEYLSQFVEDKIYLDVKA